MINKGFLIVIVTFMIITFLAIDLPLLNDRLNSDSSLYAMGWFRGRHNGGNTGGQNAPEPTIIVMLVGGAAGIGIYRYIRHNKKDSGK